MFVIVNLSTISEHPYTPAPLGRPTCFTTPMINMINGLREVALKMRELKMLKRVFRYHNDMIDGFDTDTLSERITALQLAADDDFERVGKDVEKMREAIKKGLVTPPN